jgi:hypothetical protein
MAKKKKKSESKDRVYKYFNVRPMPEYFEEFHEEFVNITTDYNLFPWLTTYDKRDKLQDVWYIKNTVFKRFWIEEVINNLACQLWYNVYTLHINYWKETGNVSLAPGIASKLKKSPEAVADYLAHQVRDKFTERFK